MNKFICPECKGSGGEDTSSVLERPDHLGALHYFVPCYYCAGTGFASDEGDFEEIVRWEK